jgi:hypothetical protein
MGSHLRSVPDGDWDGPIWAPDGSRIAFSDGRRRHVPDVAGRERGRLGSPEEIPEVEVKAW